MFGIRRRFCASSGELCAVFIPCFALLLTLMTVVDAIKIQSISVPDRVNSNSSEPLHLDCHFEFNSTESAEANNVILKWFLNETLIYQRSNQSLFISDIIKSRIPQDQKNFTNTRSTNMPLTIYNKTIELTGWYMCRVELILVEDSKQKYMHVYVPTNEITLTENLDEELNQLNVTCSAEGVYPEPNLTLIIGNQRIENASEYVVLNRNPLYDINATYTIIASDLPSYTVFNCSLSIPEVNWTQSKTLSYAKAGFGDGYRTSSVQQSQDSGASLMACCSSTLLLLFLLLPFRLPARLIFS